MIKIPLSDEMIKFDFPDYQMLELGDTIRIFLLNDKKQNLASAKFIIKNGASDDSVPGISYLTSQMLLRGTSEFSADILAEKAESLGSGLRSSAQWDDVVLSSTCLTGFFPEILKLLCDALLDSTFPEHEFIKLQKKHISTIQQESTDINYLSSVAFNKTIFSGGYAQPLLGTISSVQSINREILYKRYKLFLENSKISIIISGNFPSDETLKYIDNRFKHLVKRKTDDDSDKILVNSKRISVIDKESSNQASIRLGRTMIDRHNPDFAYVQIVNVIYGGFFLSRLNKILREGKGYTYGIQSMVDSRKNATIQMIASSINIDALAESIRIIINENKNLRDSPVTGDELHRAVRYILGSFLRSTETPQQISSLIQSLDMFGLGRDFYIDYYNRTSRAGLADIQNAIEKYFLNDDFVITAAGDLKIIGNQLSEFGNADIIELN